MRGFMHKNDVATLRQIFVRVAFGHSLTKKEWESLEKNLKEKTIYQKVGEEEGKVVLTNQRGDRVEVPVSTFKEEWVEVDIVF